MFETYHLELGLFAQRIVAWPVFAQRIVAWPVGEAVSCFVTTTLLSCRNSLQEILFASDVNFQQKLIAKPHKSYGQNKNNMLFPTIIDKLIALGRVFSSATRSVPSTIMSPGSKNMCPHHGGVPLPR